MRYFFSQQSLKWIKTYEENAAEEAIKYREVTDEKIYSPIYAFLQNVTVGLMLIVVGIAGMVIPILAQKILRKNRYWTFRILQLL